MENNNFSLPDLISSLSQIERGNGFFSSNNNNNNNNNNNQKNKNNKNNNNTLNNNNIKMINNSILSKSYSLLSSTSNHSPTYENSHNHNSFNNYNQKPKTTESLTRPSSNNKNDKNNKNNNLNSYQKIMEQTKTQGLEEHQQQSSYNNNNNNNNQDEIQQQDQNQNQQNKISSGIEKIEIPEYILQFKKDWEEVHENRLRLPLLRQLSPRSRKRATLLPPPNSLDLAKLAEYEKIGKDKNSSHLYQQLNEISRREQIKMYQNGNVSNFTQYNQQNNHNNHLNDKKKIELEPKKIEVLQNSTSVFDDVKKRKIRKLEQLNRVSVFATPEDGFSEASSSIPSKRPLSPKISSYPFQTELVNIIKNHPLTQSELLTNQNKESISPTLKSKGRKPPSEFNININSDVNINSGIVLEVKQKMDDKNNQLNKIGQSGPSNVLEEEYTPLLQEVTTVANNLLESYDNVAHQYNEQAIRNHQMKKENQQFLNQWKSKLYDDLGVDVDPIYNARVKYGRAVTMVIYYTYTMKTKYTFNQWKQFVRFKNHERIINAGALLVRIGRGMIARMEVREIKLNIKKQKEAEEEYERQRMAFRSFMCRKIQKVWKKYLKRKQRKIKEKRRNACIKIQSLFRGTKARTYVKWLRIYRSRCKQSATMIQTTYRIHLAKRKLTLLRKLAYVKQWELSRAEKIMLQRMNYRLHGAAITVARAYRAHTIHTRLQSLLYWNRFTMALKIQCLYRGYVVRKQYYRLTLAKKKREEERKKAATIIQSHVRMRNAINIYYKMREAQRERDEKRKKRKKKLLKEKYVNIGDKKINVTKTIRNVRTFLRSMMPLRYIWERVHARTIQRYWRGYRGRKRALMMKVQIKIREVYAKRDKREHSALMIQKVYRGHRRRHTMKKEVWYRKATLIQCYWRRKAARREADRRRAKIHALSILNNLLSVLVVGMKVRKKFRLEKLYSRYVNKIQRLARRYIGRIFLRKRKDRLRLHEDGLASASLTTLRIMSSIQLMIIKESLSRDIGIKPRTVSGLQCPCYGPGQSLFVSALGKKGRSDSELLTSNKMDTTSLQKLISKIEELTLNDKKDKDKNKKLLKALKSRTLVYNENTLMLFHAIRISIVRLPKIIKPLSSSDVDILFNKYKSTVGGNVMNYSEFINLLSGIGDFSLEKILLSRQMSYNITTKIPSRPVSPIQNLNGITTTTTTTTPTTTTTTTTKPISPLTNSNLMISKKDSSEISITNSTIITQNVVKTIKKSQKLTIQSAILKYLYHNQNLIYNKESQSLSIMLYFLLTCENESWFENVNKWITSESYARASSIIIPLQQMIRRKLAYAKVRNRRKEKEKEDEVKRIVNSVIALQRLVRSYLNWKIAVRLAQVTLIKYVPHKGLPYWYNPRTRVSTYRKPKILGSYNCLEIPLPPPKLEYIIICGNCEINPASVNCLNCEDSMCKTCFSTLHCRGKKLLHTYQLIQHCSLCRYQMATKSCLTCSLSRPTNKSAQSLITGDRGILCDTCYIHVHTSESMLGNENGNNHNNISHVKINDNSKESYLISQSLNERIQSNHRYNSLVQVCEECQWRGASYRCDDCDQIYCNKCLIGLHSIGGPFSKHKAEKLPYFTPDMAKKFDKAMMEKRLQLKIERVAQLYAHKRQELRVLSAIKIQSWWRMILGKRKGKQYMKEKRMLLRKKARLRKYEDYTYRNTLLYQIRNILGFTPKLSSDTLEERILGKHHLFARDRIRHYIYNNIEDWGYFHIQSKKKYKRTGEGEIIPLERKGIPKTGFQVGRYIELVDQAKRGGYRFPGKINMIRGEIKHTTTINISSLLEKGQYIRIGRQILILMKIEENILTFNRRWRFPDRKNMPIYLLPCYPGERHRRYYKSRIILYDIIVGNQISQLILQGYKRTNEYLEKKSINFARSNKRIGLMVSAQKWTKRAEKFNSRCKWADNLLYEDGGPPDTISLGENNKKSNGLTIVKKSPEERLPGELWEANDDEKDKRRQRERNMTRQELLDEAPLWEERFDALINKPTWVNKNTFEVTYEMPRAIMTFNIEREEAEKKHKQFLEAQKRLTEIQRGTPKKMKR